MAEPTRLLPDLLRAVRETPISPKDFVALETHRVAADHETRRLAIRAAQTLGLSAMGASGLFAVLGVVFVLLAGDQQRTDIDLFGFGVGTDSVGVACVALGAGTFLWSLRAVLKVMDSAARAVGGTAPSSRTE
ncbi:hypothetical protein [Roseospira navarrensis]|uniref:Uncharacterized protein n=1 Tax=Roseospira navarrensis TaxID=140058 RepID=A0A7X1ZC53_9PROT|nr:hypothetical protein [Roseospira navarrensis]MQX35637.1 hypothetical protein [Roseospira navarrensis]